ncbi:MAG: hypothetical protein ABGY96_21620 [bacterium]
MPLPAPAKTLVATRVKDPADSRILKNDTGDSHDAKSSPETETALVGLDSEPLSPYPASRSKIPSSIGSHPKISPAANEALNSYVSGQAPRSFRAAQVRFDHQGYVQLNVHVAGFGQSSKESVQSLGAIIEVVNEELELLQIRISYDRVTDLAELPFVVKITPPQYATTRTGAILTEGDRILNAELVRAMGVDDVGFFNESFFENGCGQRIIRTDSQCLSECRWSDFAGSHYCNSSSTECNRCQSRPARICDRVALLTSNLNFVAGQIVANNVVAPIGNDGSVCLYSNVPTDVIVDVSGWFSADA